MPNSVKTNYILNLINTGTQYLFPIVTFPYASRIMQAEGIGIVNFYQSIISYIILLTGLGIPMYGIKEIARVRDNKKQLSNTLLEIFELHLFFTVLGYFVVMALFFVPSIQKNYNLFLLLSMSLLFTTIGCEWFYKGIEDFKYIMVRGVFVKFISAILLFCFVKERSDILWYGFVCVVGTLGGNLFNFYRLRLFVKFDRNSFFSLQPFRHLKPVLSVFIFSIITSLYINLNPILLGFLSNETAVGYYTTSIKLFSITTSISGSLSVVMLPRVSYMVAEGKKEELNKLIQKAYDFSIGLSLPLCVGLIFCSPYAIHLLSGDGFEPSIICVQVLAPIVLFLSLSSLFGTQVLFPLGKIKVINYYCAAGAVFDIVITFLLVPSFGQLGTSISYCLSELLVMMLALCSAYKYVKVKYINRNIWNYIIGTLFVSAILFILVKTISYADYVVLLIMFIASLIVYLSYLLVVKDPLLNSVYLMLIKKNNVVV